MLQQVISLSLITTMAALPRASSQGIPKNSCSTSCNAVAAPVPRVMVATPYPSNSADSINAVALGNTIRDKVSRNLGSEWAVIARLEMNRNLANSGYPADALLATEQAFALARYLNARVVITTALAKGADGRYTANTRFVGISDDAGEVVKTVQTAGQPLSDFGSKIGEQLTIVFKAYNEAKNCNDQQVSAPAKAIESANKALKLVPNFGYAEYCLGAIAQQKDSASSEVLADFKNAADGDPMSLKAVNWMFFVHLKKNDSAAVVADFQRMITIAPTNRPLAEHAIDVFRQFNRPDAADSVVNLQMSLDPTSPDWPDLKGNSCARQAVLATDPVKAKPKYVCAYDAFSQEYTLDPTRGDSLFFQRIIFVAQNQADSLTWVKRFAEKFPTSSTALEMEAALYTETGKVDSAVAIVNLMLKLDTTTYKPAIAVTMALLDSHHEDAALQFLPFFKKYGDDNAKNTYAGVLIRAADSASRRTPQADSVMAHLGRAVIALNPPSKQLVEFGNYFVVRALSDSLSQMSQAVRDQKSCDYLKRYDVTLAELEPALLIITASSNTGIAGYGNQLLGPVQGERKNIPAMQSQFCHP